MKTSRPSFRALITTSSLLWITVILLLGSLTAVWSAGQVDRQMRTELLGEAERLVETLDPSRLSLLAATESDTQLAQYQRLKRQLQSVRQAFARYRFVYLMARRPDGTVVFLVDSEPPGSADESLPGDIYQDMTAEDLGVFDSGIAVVSGPSEDQWGVWVSALAPVRTPTTVLNELALGIDIDARDWRGQVLLRGVLPVALATLALLAILMVWLTQAARRKNTVGGSSGPLRYLEPAVVLAAGLVLTLTITWIVRGQTINTQARSFELLAQESTQGVSRALHNLRDFGLGGLVRLFQASDFVSEEEFIHYADLLAENNLPRHWAWAPEVPVSQRAEWEQKIRDRDGSEFRIWEAEGIEPPAAITGRQFHFPITRQTNRLPELSLRGFDLASLARVREPLEAARRTGLVTASAPLDGDHAPQLRGQILIIQSTGQRLRSGLPEGVIVTSAAFDDILAASTAAETLAMDLWLLQENGSRELLAHSGPAGVSDNTSLTLERPILLFGETFLVRTAADRGHAVAQARLTIAGTALAGLLLTLMLAMVVGLIARRREGLEQAVSERTAKLQEFRTAVEQSNDGIALSDLDGRIRFVNPAWASMHGYRLDELTGQHLSIFHTAEQMEREVAPTLAELIEKGHAESQGDHLHRDGHCFPARTSASLVRDERGEPIAMLGIGRDISAERRQHEQERFNQRFRALMAEIAAGFVTAADGTAFERRLDKAMASLGTLFEVDRAYLFRFSADMKTASNTHEWCAAGIEPQKQSLQNLTLADKGWWMDQWRAKRSIRIEDIERLPGEAASERALLEAQDIRSLVCVPIQAENAQLLGFLGFDSVRCTRSWPNEQVAMLQVVADILAGAIRRREAIQALAESESSYRELAAESRSFRWQVDLEGLYTDVDPLVSDVLGYQPEDLVGQCYFYDLSPEDDRERTKREGLRQINSGRRFSGYQNRVLTRDGRILWVSTTVLPLYDSEGRLIGVRGSDTDITERKQAELQLQHLAHHDLLTSLPNRVLLADRLQQAMAQADRRGELLGVACLDLDAFKPINDRFGHEVGDRLLVEVAKRMRQAIRQIDTVARLGGDEFALVLVGLQDAEAARPLLDRVLRAVAEPMQHDGHRLEISASLGISFYPQDDSLDADQLLRQADQAMYQAKLAGKNCQHRFDAAHDRMLRSSHRQIDRIRQGLEDGEFVLHYQPKVDMKKGRLIGMEALIRWEHPEEGLLPPAAFLPLLQQHHLMIRLGDWVIESALTRISDWRHDGLEIPVSINVDPLQLTQPDFIERLGEALARYPDVQAGDLELEVLETSALDETVPMVEIIKAADRLGVTFSLDDFGTGYSSLAYLKRLPVATLKIDRSFVLGMLADPDDLAILQGVISLARNFHKDVIAEGVETEAHGEMLLQLGCRLGQGYAIARPMPGEDVTEWIASWRPPRSWLDARVQTHRSAI
ncbi:MAG: EAL domain-containing protein [Wenzhouxiangella sp.]|jgi:diguanylate cyclase (GGDEF)-like protein/PAS domain S-box-containing protein|nr:EAL domain-containing protein [Wenzhouxiangella sp.]